MLDSAPKVIAYPLLASVYRSILCEAKVSDYSLFISGPTGCFKSSITAILQAHFGQNFNTNRLPDNWTSTENALEKKSFLAKDALFTIDEWTANGTNSEADRLRSKAERILRSQGNQSGRGRMMSNCDMRPEYYPRGIIVSTGEDIPPGQSLRARTIQIELSHGDINLDQLSKLQEAAASGLLSGSTSSFIMWLAPQMKKLKNRIARLHRQLRKSVVNKNMHNRTPDITASLGIGLRMFLKFAVSCNAITRAEMRTLWNEGWASLQQVAQSQQSFQTTEDHATKFIGHISYALNMDEAYLRNIDGSIARTSLNERAQKIGWINNNEVYLDPDAAFSLVQQLARKQNEHFPLTKNTLWKRLAQKGLIIPSDSENRNSVKKTVEGRRQYVLVFPDKSIFFEKADKHIESIGDAV